MISSIGYTPFLGYPAVLWIGLIGMLCFLAAGTIQFCNLYTKIRIPVKWHVRFGVSGLIIMFIHAVLAIAIYL